MLRVDLSVKGGPVITGELNIGDLDVATLPSGGKTGYGRMLLTYDNKTYAHVLIWSYWKTGGKLWHEVSVQNCSIENGVGYYEADVDIKLELLSDITVIERKGVKFFDGTAWNEIIGEPFLALVPGAEKFYNRYVPDNDQPILEAALESKWDKQMESYPHKAFHSENWHSTLFDTVFNTHQAGSARNVGSTWTPGLYLGVLNKHIDTELFAETKISEITKYVFGWIGQQSRRPIHFLHDTNSIPYTFDEFKEKGKFVMGETGPSKIWGGNVLWGRDKLDTKQGAWNGWDHEHFSVDQLVVGYLFYSSQYCFMQLRLLLEAIMSHPHLQYVQKTASPRVWGWNFRALAWGLFINPFTEDKIRYKNALDILVSSYEKFAVTSQIPSVFDNYADPKHLYPTGQEMLDWYNWWGLPLPDGVGDYDPILDSKSLANYLVSNLKTFGWDELTKCLYYFSFCSCFQLATIASAITLYLDMLPNGDAAAYRIGQHLMFCLMTKARNPNGTFWYDYSVNIPNKVSGTGTETNGVTAWVAGAVGMLWNLVPQPFKPEVKKAILSVYANNKYTKPGEQYTFFATWFLPTAYYLGYPDEL